MSEKKYGEPCWVFIEKDKNASYKINLTGNMDEYVTDKKMVYCRLCSDTLLALGLCMVLRKLSRKSLEKIIRGTAPPSLQPPQAPPKGGM